MQTALLIALAAAVAIGVVWFGVRMYIDREVKKRQAARRAKEDNVLLSIKVSKVNEQGPGAAEQMFASLHGMLKALTFSDRWQGEYQEHLSFEITCHRRNIEFFVWAPRHLKEFVEGQIYAQYPDVEIREVTDYTHETVVDDTIGKVAPASVAGLIAEPNAGAPSTALVPLQTPAPPSTKNRAIGEVMRAKVVVATEIILTKNTALPIKLASEFGAVDPLSGITATLGKLDSENEEVWLQILVKPVPDSWQESGVKLAENMRDGKVTKKTPLFLTILAAPFKAIGTLVSFLTPGGDEAAAPKKEEKKKELSEADKRFVEGVIGKAGKLGYEVKIRTLFLSGDAIPQQVAKTRLQSIVGSFKQFNTTMLNGFAARALEAKSAMAKYRDRAFDGKGFVLNIEELSTLYHLPNVSVKTPNIVWVTSKKTEPPVNLPTPDSNALSEMTLIGETNFRGYRKMFGIKTADRMRHMYIIGKTGMGKSVLLENIAISDVLQGRGITVVDPHGDLADHVLESIPAARANDVILFDPSDTAHPVALNLLENINPEYRPLVASGIVAIFYKLFANSWGPRLEHVLRNTLLALLETPGTTMLGIMRMLVDQGYRDKIVANVKDPVVRSFWVDEFANYQPKNMAEIVGPIQNKVGQFLSSHVIRNILGQEKSTINIREAMDSGKIFIANLSKGKLGDDASALLGSMLITKIQLDAMSRANVSEDKRVDHHLIVDEFQNFATDAFATILSEARKYRLSLTMANQYVAQMSDVIKGAVFGNVGTLISFQTGYDDATYFSNQYAKQVTDVDIMGLDKYTVYIRLLIDNQPSTAFSAFTLPPASLTSDHSLVEEIRDMSRKKYAKPRAEVEDTITKWSEEGRAPAKKAPTLKVEQIPLGAELKAIVSNVQDLGIFIDFEGLGGLIHNSEIPDKGMKDKTAKGEPITCWLMALKDGTKLSCTLNAKKAELLRAANPPKPGQLGTPEYAAAKQASDEAAKAPTPDAAPATQPVATATPAAPQQAAPPKKGNVLDLSKALGE